MKRLFLFSILLVFVLTFTTYLYAAEKAPLGAGNLALKLDYINFTESILEDLDVDAGLYVGLEAYSEIADVAPNFYIGTEVGYASPEGNINVLGINVDTETTFVPIELNLKYAIKATPNLVIDLGAGASLNYANIKLSLPAFGLSEDDDDWLFGGQVFANLNYKFKQFFVGINAKYQMTENYEIEDTDTDIRFKNWRIGGQIGIMF